jgi:hypothetical protein
MGGFRHLREGKYTPQKMPPESALHGIESLPRTAAWLPVLPTLMPEGFHVHGLFHNVLKSARVLTLFPLLFSNANLFSDGHFPAPHGSRVPSE